MCWKYYRLQKNEKKPSRIVLNAFTTPFVLEAEVYDVFENMKSRLPDEEIPNAEEGE